MNTLTENDIKFLQVLKSQGVSKEDAKQRLIDVKRQKSEKSSLPEPQKERGFFGKLLDADREANQMSRQYKKDLAVGAAKSVGETLAGASEMGESFIKGAGRVLTPKALEDDFGFAKDQPTGVQGLEKQFNTTTEELFKADNTAQSIGKIGADIAQFAVPASVATKGVKATQVAANASKGAKVANSLKNAGKIAAVDAAASLPIMGAKEGELNSDAVKNAAIGGAIGGAVNIAGDVVSSLKSSGSELFEKARQSAGQIAQGDPSDQLVMMKAIDEIDTGGIETYKDLSNAFDETIKKNLTSLDDMLDASDIRLTTDNAVSAIKAGEETISKSPIEEGLDALDEFYTNVKQPEDLARIRELKQAFQEGGLSLRETNDLAREIGRQRSGFLASGNPSTSLSKQAYENIRTGLKDLVRSNIGDDSAKLLDQQVSDFITGKSLSDDMIKKGEKLKQKISERGFGERVGRLIGSAVDQLTFGGIKGLSQKLLVTSNRGFKTLNTLDLEDDLARNIKVIEMLVEKLDNKSVRKSLTNIDKAIEGIGEIQIIPITKDQIDAVRNVGGAVADEVASN